MSEKRHKQSEFLRFLRVLWRAVRLFVIALEKEFDEIGGDNRKLK